MPCSCCQEPLVGLVNKSISMPTQWVWVKVSSWLPKPSLNNTLNPEEPGIPAPFSLHHYHLTSAQSRPVPTDSRAWGCYWMMGSSQAWLETIIPGVRPNITKGQNWGQRQWDQWTAPPTSPSPSPDGGFKSDQSSVLTSSSVSLRSDRSECSRHSHCGQWCHRESGGHMKINLPIFKDENMKDAITYQSWHWNLMVYHHAGCYNCTLLSYAICSLQGYPGNMVRSSGTDIIIDDILTILYEHYNNVKALDALNQEVFQLCMGKKETVLDCGVHLSRHHQVLVASFLECFPLDHITELKCDCFYSGLPKHLKAIVAYLKASTNEKTHSDYLRAVREAEKEDAMEPSCNQTVDITSKPKMMSFFPL